MTFFENLGRKQLEAFQMGIPANLSVGDDEGRLLHKKLMENLLDKRLELE
jgi:hypothetical protein